MAISGPPPHVETEDDPSGLSPLPWVLTHGLTAVATFGFLSFLSSVWLFIFLTCQFFRWQLGPSATVTKPASPKNWTTPTSDVDGFLVPPGQYGSEGDREAGQPRESFLKRFRKDPPNQFLILIYNLLLADIQQALAFLLNVTWLSKHALEVDSPVCWVQGWFISVGDLASSVFITAIAIHTYLGVVKNYRPRTSTFYWTIAGLWAFVYGTAVLGVIITRNGEGVGGLYVRAGAWCWINSAYQDLRLYLHYLWIFISLALTASVYVVIFFHIHARNRPAVIHSLYQQGSNPPVTPPSRNSDMPPPSTSISTASTAKPLPLPQPQKRHSTAGTITFLLYPIIYILCTAPLAAGRIASMAGNAVPLSFFCFAGSMIASAGWLDVALYASTRRSIVFSGENPPSQDTGIDTFAFMTLRTPERVFGNAVFVEGGKKMNQLANRCGILGLWVWIKGWIPVRVSTVPIKKGGNGPTSRVGSLRGASARNKSSETLGSMTLGSMQGFGMGDGAVMGNAIQCETTTTVTVEEANDPRGSWYIRGVRVVNN